MRSWVDCGQQKQKYSLHHNQPEPLSQSIVGQWTQVVYSKFQFYDVHVATEIQICHTRTSLLIVYSPFLVSFSANVTSDFYS